MDFCSFLQADLSLEADIVTCVDKAVELLPGNRLDLLINNAGAGVVGQLLGKPETTLARYREVFDLDVMAPYMLTNAAIHHLEKTEGCIINLSSVAAQRPLAGFGNYCMAKAAVDMLTKVSALEFAPKRVRVNAIAPASVETNFHSSAGMSPETARAYYEASCSTHPIGRVGKPDDISEMALYLADNTRAGEAEGTMHSCVS